MCVCGERSDGPCLPGPPSVNWKRRLLSQRRGSNQAPVSETKRDFMEVDVNHRRLRWSQRVEIM